MASYRVPQSRSAWPTSRPLTRWGWYGIGTSPLSSDGERLRRPPPLRTEVGVDVGHRNPGGVRPGQVVGDGGGPPDDGLPVDQPRPVGGQDDIAQVHV